MGGFCVGSVHIGGIFGNNLLGSFWRFSLGRWHQVVPLLYHCSGSTI